jgi:hypothetical protein
MLQIHGRKVSATVKMAFPFHLCSQTFLFNCVIFILGFACRDVKIEKGEDANVLDAAAKVNKQFPDMNEKFKVA